MKINSLLISSSFILIISLISIFNTINIVSEANEPDIFLDVANEPDIFLDVNTTDKNISTEPIETPTVPTEIIELIEFLERDTTSDHIYAPKIYDCSYFARDLSKNASKENIEIGSILLHHHPNGRGWGHAMNYIIVNDIFYIISPESDFICSWDEYKHNKVWDYYRLYPDGTLIPARWKYMGGLNPIEELTTGDYILEK